MSTKSVSGITNTIRLPTIAALLAVVTSAAGQNAIIQDDRIHTARRLAGTIYAGETESPGHLLPDAKIDLCDKQWRHCTFQEHADSKAHFSLHPAITRDIYYLRITSPNCNPLLLKIRLDPRSHRDLIVSVTIAT